MFEKTLAQIRLRLDETESRLSETAGRLSEVDALRKLLSTTLGKLRSADQLLAAERELHEKTKTELALARQVWETIVPDSRGIAVAVCGVSTSV